MAYRDPDLTQQGIPYILISLGSTNARRIEALPVHKIDLVQQFSIFLVCGALKRVFENSHQYARGISGSPSANWVGCGHLLCARGTPKGSQGAPGLLGAHTEEHLASVTMCD